MDLANVVVIVLLVVIVLAIIGLWVVLVSTI